MLLTLKLVSAYSLHLILVRFSTNMSPLYRSTPFEIRVKILYAFSFYL